MSRIDRASHDAGVDNVYVLLEGEDSTTIVEPLTSLLPMLNWRAHLFVLAHSQTQPQPLSTYDPICERLSHFLQKHSFLSVHVHPTVPPASDLAEWERLLGWMRAFQRQAYVQQSEARLLILPLVMAAKTSSEGVLTSTRLLQAQFVRLALHTGDAQPARREPELRYYVDEEPQTDDATAIWHQLQVNHVFESLLERSQERARRDSAQADPGLLQPCRSHLVLDAGRGQLFACFVQHRRQQALCSLGELVGESGAALPEVELERDIPPELCEGCIHRAMLAMRANLVANDRESEGQGLHQELAVEYTRLGQHERACLQAQHAAELAGSQHERAAAFMHVGLSHFALHRLEEAEQALAEAQGIADDPALVAFHRGRVQFEWRDYIEALDRFEEVLGYRDFEANPPEEIPTSPSTIDPRQLFFYMAVSHVKLEEWPEARPYIERWEHAGGNPASTSFYRGLCELGEGKLDQALHHFLRAEQLGPARDDLANVLFYVGYCHKETQRYDEAISWLARARRADPQEIGIVNLLGFCYYKQKRHDEAVECFRCALQIDPRSGLDHANLASNLRDLGRTQEAIEHYRIALRLDPTLAFARANLRRLMDAL